MTTAAQTILQLQKQRAKAERDHRDALLEIAEMKHELAMLRAMRADITTALTDRRILSQSNRINKVARIVRMTSARVAA